MCEYALEVHWMCEYALEVHWMCEYALEVHYETRDKYCTHDICSLVSSPCSPCGVLRTHSHTHSLTAREYVKYHHRPPDTTIDLQKRGKWTCLLFVLHCSNVVRERAQIRNTWERKGKLTVQLCLSTPVHAR